MPTRLVKHGLDVSAARGGQALDQGRPVDVAVESHHVQSRDAGAFDDSKTVAGRMQAPHRADLVRKPEGNADTGTAEVVEQADQPGLQAAGERGVAEPGKSQERRVGAE